MDVTSAINSLEQIMYQGFTGNAGFGNGKHSKDGQYIRFHL